MPTPSNRIAGPASPASRPAASAAAWSLAWVATLAAAPLSLVNAAEDPHRALSRDLFRELIEINTTDTARGSVTLASEAMAKRLRDAGFPAADVQVLGPNDRKKNVVVRLRGTGKHKPVLLIGHLDVVEARPEDWTTDPFKLVEKDGYFYGRGTQDMKDGDAIMTATLIRMKKEGFKPSRDIILAMTADEEGGTANGVEWLFANHRELVDAEFVLNHDGASVTSENGKPVVYQLESSQKVYADFRLSTKNPGGHSSQPRPDNAIYELTEALQKVSQYQFPFELTNITRAYYESMAKIVKGQRADDMRAILKDPADPAAVARLSQDSVDNAIMRTNCVATRLGGGHANNALPQSAEAVINCRILPGHSPEEVRQQLVRVIASSKVRVQSLNVDDSVTDTASDVKGFAPPPLRQDVMQILQKLVKQYWAGIPIVPSMSPGASDDVFVNAAGLPSYTVTGIAIDRDDERAHGQDERLRTSAYDTGTDFYYQFLKTLTSK